MKVGKIIIGTLLITFSAIMILFYIVDIYSGGNGFEQKFMFYSVIALIVGVIIVCSVSDNSNAVDRREFEEFKRMKQQEMAQLYRFANATGKPIEEYLMDDRTKLITYYDRMPQKYKQKLLERADVLYRQFESEEYTNKK